MGEPETEIAPPGFTGECFPDVFTKMPPQPTVKKPGHLPIEKVQEFFEQGYTVVENFFTPEELQPSVDACNGLVDMVAQKLYKAGKIKNLHEDKGFRERLIHIEQEWTGAVMLLLKLGKLPQAFRDLWAHPKLLDAMEQLLGPEVATNPVWNLRPKAPGHAETLVPWHQDSAYFDFESYKTLIATAWVPFVDTYQDNGCLEMAVGGHKIGMVVEHSCCNNFYLMTDEKKMKERLGVDTEKDTKLCPVKFGGMVLFSNVIPHRSVPNIENMIRWSIDLRYQEMGKPWGFWGMKPGILLRSAKNPNLVPDWESFDAVDRYEEQKKYEIRKTGQGEIDEFDTTITGPHMDMWNIVQHNQHVDQFLAEKKLKKNKEVKTA